MENNIYQFSLTENDIEFIISIYGEQHRTGLVNLLTDESMQDMILNSSKMLDACENPQMSFDLYLFINIKTRLKILGIADANNKLTNYILNIFNRFNSQSVFDDEYISCLLESINPINAYNDFITRKCIGEYLLYFNGFKPEKVKNAEHKFEYYIAIGSASLRTATKLLVCEEFCLKEIFSIIHSNYAELIKVLNTISTNRKEINHVK